MGLWVDVLNSSGVPYGDGPITTAMNWKTVESLDAMGSFSFSMPAADPQSSLLANKRHVRAYLAGDTPTQWPQGVMALGYGIIDNITVLPAISGPTMIEVSGSNLLAELANTTAGDLDLFTDAEYVPLQVKHQNGMSTVWTPGDSINLVPLDPGPLSYIIVSHPDVFRAITVTLGASKNTTSATLQAQYFNVDTSPKAWEPIDLVDGTKTGGKPFAQDGTISFEPPSGWGAYYSVSGTPVYEIRIYCNDNNITNVTFDTFHVTVREPTATALQDIMALAPDGWTLDTAAGYAATLTSVYLQMTNQSILATLGRVAELTGEHFILSPFGRRVLWIGTDRDTSGLHALAANPGADGAVDDFALYILGSPKIVKNSKPLFSRIYPKGGGNGTAQITLLDSTVAVPTGYTINKTLGYIERDAAISEFGRIDAPADFPHIVPFDRSKDARKHAGNTLVQEALEKLKRGSYQQYAYDISVVASKHRIYPGQTITVSYHEWVDNFHSVNVEQELWVLDVATSISATGDLLTVGLTVALVDSYPLSDDARIAQEIMSAFSARLQPLQPMGLVSQGSGVPYHVEISDGQVTTVKRQKALANGDYQTGELNVGEDTVVRWYIRIANGLVTLVYSEVT